VDLSGKGGGKHIPKNPAAVGRGTRDDAGRREPISVEKTKTDMKRKMSWVKECAMNRKDEREETGSILPWWGRSNSHSKPRKIKSD